MLFQVQSDAEILQNQHTNLQRSTLSITCTDAANMQQTLSKVNKKAVLSQGNRAMLQLFFSV